jgi:hypothetical protein
MRKYDVTGVGLHLGTAEEFVRKTGLRLPPGHDETEVSAMTVFSESQIVRQYYIILVSFTLYKLCLQSDEYRKYRSSIVCCISTGIWLCTAR